MVHPSPAGTGLGTLPEPEDVASLNLPVIQEPSEGSETARVAKALAKADERTAGPEGMLPSQPATKEGERSNSSEIGAFVLGEGLPPVPAKLVAKILKGEFIDMAELLWDNIEAERRRGGSDTTSSQLRAAQREIPDILSWFQCFGVFASVVASKHPDKVLQLLAYQTTIVREARRCGGAGWQAYDTMFRQHAATDPFTDWSKLNSSLYAVTFLAQSNGRGRCCQYCLESDHGGQECALAPNYQPDRPQRPGGWGPMAGGRLGEGRNDWRQEPSTGGKGKTRMARQLQLDRVCYAWNDGDCKFPACRYQHVCAKCQGEHRAPACSTYPHKQREAAPK